MTNRFSVTDKTMGQPIDQRPDKGTMEIGLHAGLYDALSFRGPYQTMASLVRAPTDCTNHDSRRNVVLVFAAMQHLR
jgi:hypothetical protein